MSRIGWIDDMGNYGIGVPLDDEQAEKVAQTMKIEYGPAKRIFVIDEEGRITEK